MSRERRNAILAGISILLIAVSAVLMLNSVRAAETEAADAEFDQKVVEAIKATTFPCPSQGVFFRQVLPTGDSKREPVVVVFGQVVKVGEEARYGITLDGNALVFYEKDPKTNRSIKDLRKSLSGKGPCFL